MDVRELHRRAMDYAEEAAQAAMQGNQPRAAELSRQAFDLERQAALHFSGQIDKEPSRSVLFRSAASLALDCRELREAERLISLGLMGNPPDEIADELRDLLETVYFHRHLHLRGVELAPTELQLSLAGEMVGFGIADSHDFRTRLDSAEKILLRTAERKFQQPFREKGRSSGDFLDRFTTFVSVPRAASFAITVRIGSPIGQGMVDTTPIEEVVEEVLTCLQLFDDRAEKLLSERIVDEAYLRNFIGLASTLAPDGRRISVVGLTANVRGHVREVGMKTPRRQQIPETQLLAKAVELNTVSLTVKGRLLFADARKQKRGEIEVVDKDEMKHRFHVPPGMMADIVKPLWETEVLVVGEPPKRGNVPVLAEIYPLDPDSEP